jgi:hypothetical protein
MPVANLFVMLRALVGQVTDPISIPAISFWKLMRFIRGFLISLFL